MKKTLFLALFCILISHVSAYAATFPESLKTCEKFYQTGSASTNGEFYTITISLEKSKNNTMCTYKEKIAKTAKDYTLLTCNFDIRLVPSLAEKMQKFNDTYKKDLAKNEIFKAKMTSNRDIFEEYVINPTYCKVTPFKK